jgi:hypothetical protein
VSGVCSRFEHMSERGLGAAEREALERTRARLIAVRVEHFRLLEDVAELERLGVAEKTGDRSTGRLLQELGLLDAPEATRWVEEAADLTSRLSLRGELLPPRLPCTATVAACGGLGPGHVAVIRKAMVRLERIDAVTVEDRVTAERTLAEKATVMSPRKLQEYVQALIEYFDPDGVAPPDGEDRGDELHMVQRRDGSMVFKGQLCDPVDGDAFRGVIDDLSGRCGPEDGRELKRRRADALKDLIEDAHRPGGLAADARRERPAPESDADGGDVEDALIPEPRRPEPEPAPGASTRPDRPGRALLTITMDHRWLQQAIGHGTLDSGAPVDPHTVRRWACDAEVVPMVLGSKSEPLDVGRLSRTVTDAIRRALNLRDGGCAFPGCSRRPRRCHAHHIRHWLDHGPTCLDNLVLLCRYHHQLIHHDHWTVEILDGLPWFTPPAWIASDRRPRLGGRPRVPLRSREAP